jgi:hypothetical protein
METDFGQAAYEAQFDDFVRHYLTVVTGEIPRLGDIDEAFKAHDRSCQDRGEPVEALISGLLRGRAGAREEHAPEYCLPGLARDQSRRGLPVLSGGLHAGAANAAAPAH